MSRQPYFSFREAVYDGVLLFLVSGLVTSIAIDYYFTKNLRFAKWVEGVLLVVVPLLELTLVVLAYSVLKLIDRKMISYETVLLWQIVVFVVAIAYSLVVKYLTYLYYFRR